MTEIWRSVKGNVDYSVSSFGRIRSEKVYRSTYKGRILFCNPGISGYPVVKIYKEGKFKLRKVHQLVAESFLDTIPGLVQINHIDGNKSNNYVGNLEYVTASENIRHSFRLGLQNVPKGEKHSFSKLSKNQVIAIRKEYAKGAISHTGLSIKYGVNRVTISDLLNKRTWCSV